MHTYSFEKLAVWNDAKEFTKTVYLITEDFPKKEMFGLVSQLRRASVSICSNIAEGTCRETSKDQAHFSTIAYGSAIEVLNQLIIVCELNYISEETYSQLRLKLENISGKLYNLRASQRARLKTKN